MKDYYYNMAESIYIAYCNDSNWLSFKGEKLPEFKLTKEEIKKHWIEAAKAAEEFIFHSNHDA